MIRPGSLVLAPMAEITHIPFRMLVHFYGGCDYYYSEMISARAFIHQGPYEYLYISTLPAPEKMILQLVSGEEKALVEAASILDSETDALGIDINMGCTAPEITKQGGGIQWMKDIQQTGKLIQKLRSVIRNKLFSIKIRAGIEHNEQELIQFVKMAAEQGIDYIVFHGRNKKDKLKKSSKWGYLDVLRKLRGMPIIANGDINSFKRYQLRNSQYQPWAVMIGRQVIREPWFFQYLRTKINNPEEKLSIDLSDCLYRFCENLEQYLPEKFHVSRIKKFIEYFHTNFFFGHQLFKAVQISPDYVTAKQRIQEYIQAHPEEMVWKK